MSTVATGTATTTDLTAFILPSKTHSSSAHYQPADVAAVAEAILDDQNVAHPTWPGAYTYNGLLFVPNRGQLKLLPGDVVAVDANGWPILISGNSFFTAAWNHP